MKMDDDLLEGDIFQVGILLYGFIGEDVQSAKLSKKAIFSRFANCCVQLLIGIFIFANFLKAEGGAYINTLENVATVLHTGLKYVLFMYYKRDIREILEEGGKRFWNYRRAATVVTTNFEGKLIAKIQRLYRLTKIVQVSVVLAVIFCLHMYFLKPLFNERTVFLFDSKIFVDSIFLDTIVLMCQYYFPCTVIPIVLGFDSLYLSLCCEVIIQVKLLKNKLNIKLSAEDDGIEADEITICIKHHLFLLSIFARMRRMYSVMLFFHYFISLVTACTDMYESFIGEADLPNQVLKFLSVSIIIGEFAFYALPAELVSSEFSDISYAIYNSKWYKSEVSLQKMALFMMTRSQREEYFSGAGLMNINIDAFGSVVRKTFSFYAIIRNLLDEK